MFSLQQQCSQSYVRLDLRRKLVRTMTLSFTAFPWKLWTFRAKPQINFKATNWAQATEGPPAKVPAIARVPVLQLVQERARDTERAHLPKDMVKDMVAAAAVTDTEVAAEDTDTEVAAEDTDTEVVVEDMDTEVAAADMVVNTAAAPEADMVVAEADTVVAEADTAVAEVDTEEVAADTVDTTEVCKFFYLYVWKKINNYIFSAFCTVYSIVR